MGQFDRAASYCLITNNPGRGSMKKCKAAGCNLFASPKAGYGFCQHHYWKFKKYGDPLHGSQRIRDKLSQEHKSEYRSLKGAIQRCYNENNPSYSRYGGRGIKVCDRWKGAYGFSHFLEDMGTKPDKKSSLDRIDVNGDYCPENCRWADDNTQAVNTTRKRACSFRGVRLCHGYYHAYLRKDGVMYSGKYHKDEKEAIKERLELERKYLGRTIS